MGGCLSNNADTPSITPDPSPTVPIPPLPTRLSNNSSSTPASSTWKGKAKSTTSSTHKPQLSASNSTSAPIQMSRLDTLRTYATLPKPTSSLPPSTLLLSTPHTIAIFDAYPKAKYHFLVLPRYPFSPRSDPDASRSIVKIGEIDDLRSLLTKTSVDVREQVMGALAETAGEVEEMIRDEMVKTEGFEWGIDIGFHAIPSMKHLHLHVISDDMLAPGMKTKKHYNSFRPDLGFFVPLVEVQRWLQQDETYLQERVDALYATEGLLSATLTCFKCDEPFNNIPKLKAHLEDEFKGAKKEGLKQIREHGRQREFTGGDDFF